MLGQELGPEQEHRPGRATVRLIRLMLADLITLADLKTVPVRHIAAWSAKKPRPQITETEKGILVDLVRFEKSDGTENM